MRTLAPVKDESDYTGLYIGTTKNLVLEGTMADKFKPLIHVSCVLFY